MSNTKLKGARVLLLPPLGFISPLRSWLSLCRLKIIINKVYINVHKFIIIINIYAAPFLGLFHCLCTIPNLKKKKV